MQFMSAASFQGNRTECESLLTSPLLENTSMNDTKMAHHAETHDNMQPCIDACSHCHETCLHTAMTHCLAVGGKHVEAGHFRLMINCAEICQTSANFMLSGSAFHQKVCAVCAEI